MKKWKFVQLVSSSFKLSCLTLITVILLLVAIEIFLSVGNFQTIGKESKIVSNPRNYKIDTSGVAIFKPNLVVSSKKVDVASGQNIYDVQYRIDSKGRRAVQAQKGKRDKNLLVMGCSFAFGTAIDGGETLADRLSEKLPKRQVYNYAIPGGSVNDQLDDMDFHDFRYSDLNQSGGDAIYFMIGDHLNRSTCLDLKCYGEGGWRLRKSTYNIKDGQMERSGLFYLEALRPMGGIFFWLANESKLVKAFNLNWNIESRTSAIANMADQFQELQKRLNEKFKIKLHVSEYPFENYGWRSQFITELEKRNVAFIPLQTTFPKGLEAGVPGDGHPNPVTVQAWAELLTRKMNF